MILKSHKHKSASVSYSLIILVHQPFTLAKKSLLLSSHLQLEGTTLRPLQAKLHGWERGTEDIQALGTHLDAPRVGGLVERVLHDLTDNLALRQDLGQVLGAKHVPQGRRRQQPRGVANMR